jgi:hypothetical protein
MQLVREHNFSQLLNLCVFVATSSAGSLPFPTLTMATNSTTLLHNVGFICTDGAATREALAAGYKFFDLTAPKEKLTEVRPPHYTHRSELNRVMPIALFMQFRLYLSNLTLNFLLRRALLCRSALCFRRPRLQAAKLLGQTSASLRS